MSPYLKAVFHNFNRLYTSPGIQMNSESDVRKNFQEISNTTEGLSFWCNESKRRISSPSAEGLCWKQGAVMSEWKRTGVWVAQWMEDLDLTPNQTRLYAEIFSLDAKGGCFASNEYFGKVLKLKRDTVSRLISELKKKGLIKQTGFDGRRRFLTPVKEKINSGLDPNQQDKFRKGIKCGLGLESKADSFLEKNSSLKYEVQKSIHNPIFKKNNNPDWKEFLTWSEKQLSFSTSLALSMLPGPEVLTGWQLSYWERFKANPR